MEDVILRTGDLKRFYKFVRKNGADSILDEDTFQLVLSSSMYSDFDMIGAWIIKVFEFNKWDEVRPSVKTAIQSAPFRLVSCERLTQKRLAKTVELILSKVKGLSIRYWLPWIIFCCEKVEKWDIDLLDDVTFCILFHEALDFAYRAKGASTASFQHMFHTDSLTLRVRARYLQFCKDCMAHDLWKCGQVQLLGNDFCEIAPFVLAHHLNVPELAISIMTYMDRSYLDHIRGVFIDQIANGTGDTLYPRYIFDKHDGLKPKNEDKLKDGEVNPSHSIPCHRWKKDDMVGMFYQKEILNLILETQPEVIEYDDVLEEAYDAAKNLPLPFLKNLLKKNGTKVKAWLEEEDHKDMSNSIISSLAQALPPSAISHDTLVSVLFRVPLSDHLLALIREPIHIHDEMLNWYLLYLLDICSRGDEEKVRKLLEMTLTLPLSSTQKIKSSYGFFDHEIYKMLKSQTLSPNIWTLLTSVSDLLTLFPRGRTKATRVSKRPISWDRILLKTQNVVAPYLKSTWECLGHLSKVKDSDSTNFLGRIIQWTGKQVKDSSDVWGLAETYSPNYLFSRGDFTPLSMAFKKQPSSLWVTEKLDEIEKYEK